MVGVRTVEDGLGGASHGYSPGVCANRLATPISAGAILSGPSAPETFAGDASSLGRGAGSGSSGLVGWMSIGRSMRPRPDRDRGRRYPSTVTPNAGPIERMDAKQVWRAALGELQVSLSPANYETWLRDTQLVDVDDQRFRIAVPNGFAKDWLETRYRSLISQTLARIVGYSVQVEFVVGRRAAPRRSDARDGRPTAIAGAGRPPTASRSGSSRPASVARAARPTSTRATRSRTSSSARPTGWPTRPACRSRSGPGTPTTRSSCTAASASARPT